MTNHQQLEASLYLIKQAGPIDWMKSFGRGAVNFSKGIPGIATWLGASHLPGMKYTPGMGQEWWQNTIWGPLANKMGWGMGGLKKGLLGGLQKAHGGVKTTMGS